MSPTQGLQSAGSGGESEPETEADGRSVGAGGRGAEAGTAHPEMQPGYETHERLCEQPEISFFVFSRRFILRIVTIPGSPWTCGLLYT